MSSVKIVAHTVGVGELEGKSIGEILAYVARVSNPGNQHNHETAPKLLKYCANNSHWSVFETVYITMEIRTSVAIATQILRHKSACFQQFSQRYAEILDGFEVYEARRQDDKNRQNSIDDLSEDVKEWFYSAQQEVQAVAYALYKEALDYGIAKECARFLLPQGTSTTLYMTANVRTWITYLWVRNKEAGAQAEHVEIADKCKAVLLELAPELESIIC